MLRITGIALLTATVVAILGCGGGSSSLPPNSPLPPPPPNISISPTSAVAGSPDLTLTVVGSNFLGETHNFSKAVWSANGSNTLLATSFVSSTKLMAVIPAALLRNPGTAEVSCRPGTRWETFHSGSQTRSVSASPHPRRDQSRSPPRVR